MSKTAATLHYETYVTGMIAWLSNRLSNSASAEYRRLFGIGVMEWRVMAHLAIEPGCSAAQISRVIGLDKAAISRTVGLLLQRGLAARQGAATRQRLRLTPAGDMLHGKILLVALQREARLLSNLSATEADLLRGLLARLLAHLPLPAMTAN